MTNMLLTYKRKKGYNIDVKTVVINQAKFEEIKKYKELLDLNIITQEEFDQKKKELLG